MYNTEINLVFFTIFLSTDYLPFYKSWCLNFFDFRFKPQLIIFFFDKKTPFFTFLIFIFQLSFKTLKTDFNCFCTLILISQRESCIVPVFFFPRFFFLLAQLTNYIRDSHFLSIFQLKIKPGFVVILDSQLVKTHRMLFYFTRYLPGHDFPCSDSAIRRLPFWAFTLFED